MPADRVPIIAGLNVIEARSQSVQACPPPRRRWRSRTRC
jgi:hypothetical protein